MGTVLSTRTAPPPAGAITDGSCDMNKRVCFMGWKTERDDEAPA